MILNCHCFSRLNGFLLAPLPRSSTPRKQINLTYYLCSDRVGRNLLADLAIPVQNSTWTQVRWGRIVFSLPISAIGMGVSRKDLYERMEDDPLAQSAATRHVSR